MKTVPKLSVIVPVYNVEKYLRRCLDSILNQSLTDLELIVIDDGSPDTCSQICDEYANKDSRVIVVHQDNKGVSAARNKGLDLAKGEWITFVDSDDFLEENAYSILLEAAEKSDSDLAIMDFAYVDENNNVLAGRERVYGDEMILSKKDIIRMQFDIPLTIRLVMFNKVFKRNTITGIYYDEDLKCAEDTLMLSQCLERVHLAVYIRQPFYRNVQREGSAMHGGLKIIDIEKSLDIHKEIAERTMELFPDLYSYAYAYYIDSIVWKMRTYGKNPDSNMSDSQKIIYKKTYKRMKKRLRRECCGIMKCNSLSYKQKMMYMIIGVTG